MVHLPYSLVVEPAGDLFRHFLSISGGEPGTLAVPYYYDDYVGNWLKLFDPNVIQLILDENGELVDYLFVSSTNFGVLVPDLFYVEGTEGAITFEPEPEPEPEEPEIIVTPIEEPVYEPEPEAEMPAPDYTNLIALGAIGAAVVGYLIWKK